VDVVFGGGFWPLGQTVGFVELDLANAADAYRAWSRVLEAPAALFQNAAGRTSARPPAEAAAARDAVHTAAARRPQDTVDCDIRQQPWRR
jgi:hypothetical protein